MACFRCGRDGSTDRTEGRPLFGRRDMWQSLSSPNDPTGEHGMWDRGGLHAMDDDEKMDEDKGGDRQ